MIQICIDGVDINVESSPELFSPNALDAGTFEMLKVFKSLQPSSSHKIFDLGCAYGTVGIYIAKYLQNSQNIFMSDISPQATAQAKENIITNNVPQCTVFTGNAWENIPETVSNLDFILCNPPYHTDFSVAKAFIEGGFKRLAVGGYMLMVTKRLDWYKNKLTTIFGGVRVTAVEALGYWVFSSQKRSLQPPRPKKLNKNTLSKKLQRKQARRSTIV